MALHQARRVGRFSLAGWGNFAERDPRRTFNAIPYTQPGKVSTHLLAIRSRDESFPLLLLPNPFLRGSVFYLGSRYKQGLRLPDVPYFSARSSRDAFFAFSPSGAMTDIHGFEKRARA